MGYLRAAGQGHWGVGEEGAWHREVVGWSAWPHNRSHPLGWPGWWFWVVLGLWEALTTSNQVCDCQYCWDEGLIESPFHGKEEEEEAELPGLGIVPASGCEGEPSTLEYVDTSAPQVEPPPVSVRIPRARVFRHRPTPYPFDHIPLAFRVQSLPGDWSEGGLSGLSDLAGTGDSASDGIARVFGRGSSGGSCISLHSGREIPRV